MAHPHRTLRNRQLSRLELVLFRGLRVYGQSVRIFGRTVLTSFHVSESTSSSTKSSDASPMPIRSGHWGAHSSNVRGSSRRPFCRAAKRIFRTVTSGMHGVIHLSLYYPLGVEAHPSIQEHTDGSRSRAFDGGLGAVVQRLGSTRTTTYAVLGRQTVWICLQPR